MKINELWQFPVKGLGGTQISQARLTADGYFPNDRKFAISNGTNALTEAASGTWMKKANFLQLMSHEAMAKYIALFDDSTDPPCLSIQHLDGSSLSIDPTKPEECTRLEMFFATALAGQLVGKPRLMTMHGQAYTDQSTPLISIASAASLSAFANATGTTADNRRFRLNIIIDGNKPFGETKLIGKHVRCGDAVLRITAPVGRCVAINVDPDTGVRGQDYMAFMRQHFGHTVLGVFAKVVADGTIQPGARFEVV